MKWHYKQSSRLELKHPHPAFRKKIVPGQIKNLNIVESQKDEDEKEEEILAYPVN